jgi:hypothetical protein
MVLNDSSSSSRIFIGEGMLCRIDVIVDLVHRSKEECGLGVRSANQVCLIALEARP